ncbi:MAG TPA: ATP-binding cassette domain-containing protein [Gemmatimonadaceae bacterium]|nr:ATP-binding cassette domain-containing protein [Gemmatimonadaceae bacterium]
MSDDEEPKAEPAAENGAVNPAAEQTPAESRAFEKDRLQPPIGKRQDKQEERGERRAPRPDEAAIPDAEQGDAPIRRGGDDTRVRRAIRSELDLDRGPEPPEPASTMEYSAMNIVALDHVYLSFDQPILEDVSFTAKAGETVAVLGESGTGKSTILKLLLRLLVPDRGRVFLDGEEITQLPFDRALRVRQKMGMVFQGAALFDSMTVYENVAYPLREHTALSEQEIEARVREKLDFVDLDPDKVLDQMPSELSGGMKKRVGIARGMANNAKIMLYDEPTSGLDPLTTGTITNLILKLQRELRVTGVVVTHDVRSAFRMASKIAVLANRKIHFFGTPEEMSGSDDPYLRDFLGGF